MLKYETYERKIMENKTEISIFHTVPYANENVLACD